MPIEQPGEIGVRFQFRSHQVLPLPWHTFPLVPKCEMQ